MQYDSSGADSPASQSPFASPSAASDQIAAGLLSQLIDEAIVDVVSVSANSQVGMDAALAAEVVGKEAMAPSIVALRVTVEGRSPEQDLLSTEQYEWRHSSESESDKYAPISRLIVLTFSTLSPACMRQPCCA